MTIGIGIMHKHKAIFESDARPGSGYPYIVGRCSCGASLERATGGAPDMRWSHWIEEETVPDDPEPALSLADRDDDGPPPLWITDDRRARRR